MLTPSPNNPLPWSKRQVIRTGFAALWAVIDANNQEVFRIDDITDGGEQTAEFIVIAANATQSIVWEIDSEQRKRDKPARTMTEPAQICAPTP